MDRSRRLHYFRSRVSQARRDVEQGLRVTLAHFVTVEAPGARAGDPAVQARHPVEHARRHGMAYELERPPYHTVTSENVWHRGIAL